MKQKRGRYGNINIKGRPGTPAYVFKSTDREFLKNIEPGIKPVVTAFISAGYDTFCSCQGHVYKNKKADNRYVELIIERASVYDWARRIRDLNRDKDVDLRFFVRLEKFSWLAHTRPYDSPVIFAIVIGAPGDKNLAFKTEILADSLLS